MDKKILLVSYRLGYDSLLYWDSILSGIKKRFNKFLPGLYEYMIARTAYFDNIFTDALNKNTPQIVLLGAGYDTRAFRFGELNKATKIIELDIATTQNRKRRCLKKTQIDMPENLSFVPINFDKESVWT